MALPSGSRCSRSAGSRRRRRRSARWRNSALGENPRHRWRLGSASSQFEDSARQSGPRMATPSVCPGPRSAAGLQSGVSPAFRSPSALLVQPSRAS
jgi:hypothetical protein